MYHAHRRAEGWFALGVTLLAFLLIGAVVMRSQSDAVRHTLTAILEYRPGGFLPTRTPAGTHTAIPSSSATVAPTAGPTMTAAPTITTTLPTLEFVMPAPTPLLLPTPDGQARSVRVPILMYHYVSDPPPGADEYRLDLSVGPRAFEEQLSYLQTQGYTSITLEDLALHLTVGKPLPPKPVILTFDDGYVDNFVYAFPLLRQYGFSGTFFVITQFLDEGRAGYVNWEQVKLMQENGMDIEAHSYSHEDLRRKSPDVLTKQIAEPRRALEEHLKKPVHFYCYPFGRYDQQTINVLQANGYWGSVVTAGGAEHSSTGLFELRRVRISGSDTLAGFQRKLQYY